MSPGPRGGEITLALCCPPVTAAAACLGGEDWSFRSAARCCCAFANRSEHSGWGARFGTGGPGLSLSTWSVPIRMGLAAPLEVAHLTGPSALHPPNGSRGYIHSEVTHDDTSLSSPVSQSACHSGDTRDSGSTQYTLQRPSPTGRPTTVCGAPPGASGAGECLCK